MILKFKKKNLKKKEKRKKEKHQYSILTHIYGIQKDGNDDPVCKTGKKTQLCIMDFGLRGRGREWDDLGEWHSNMYTIM